MTSTICEGEEEPVIRINPDKTTAHDSSYELLSRKQRVAKELSGANLHRLIAACHLRDCVMNGLTRTGPRRVVVSRGKLTNWQVSKTPCPTKKSLLPLKRLFVFYQRHRYGIRDGIPVLPNSTVHIDCPNTIRQNPVTNYILHDFVILSREFIISVRRKSLPHK